MMASVKIGILNNYLHDHFLNYFSIIHMPVKSILQFAKDCWHMRIPYYSNSAEIYRVPVPTTLQGSCVVHTNIVPLAQGNNYAGLLGGYGIIYSDKSNTVEAKFAELIIISKRIAEIYEKNAIMDDSEWYVKNIRGLPVLNVPIHPVECLRILDSNWKNEYNFTKEDLTESIKFWSKHGLIN